MPCHLRERSCGCAALSTQRSATGFKRQGRSTRPDLLVSVVVVVTLLPILLSVVMFAVTLVSFVQRTGAVWTQVAMYLPFVALAFAALLTWRAMRRAETNWKAWAMCLFTVTLLIIAAFPPVYSLSKAMAEELCESAPGGRGYAGASLEAPGICDWARD